MESSGGGNRNPSKGRPAVPTEEGSRVWFGLHVLRRHPKCLLRMSLVHILQGPTYQHIKSLQALSDKPNVDDRQQPAHSPASMDPIMTGLGGDAPMMLSILWSLTFVAFVFVLLRLYTRVKVVEAYGWDDHFFNASFVSTYLQPWPGDTYHLTRCSTGNPSHLRCYADNIITLRLRARHGRDHCY